MSSSPPSSSRRSLQTSSTAPSPRRPVPVRYPTCWNASTNRSCSRSSHRKKEPSSSLPKRSRSRADSPIESEQGGRTQLHPPTLHSGWSLAARDREGPTARSRARGNMTVENLSLRADVSLSTSLLRVAAADAAALRHFEGAAAEGHGGQVLEGPLSASNAAALRAEFTQLQPTLIGRTGVSVGTGDRLGLATAGHIRAFGDQGAGVVPVLAQQSIREM